MKTLASWLSDRLPGRSDGAFPSEPSRAGTRRAPTVQPIELDEALDEADAARPPEQAADAVSRAGRTAPPGPAQVIRSSKPEASPFLEARSAYATLAAANVAATRMWQMIAAIALLLAIAAVGGNVWQASRSTMVPYVIEVDRLGVTAAVGAATYSGEANPTVIQSFLAAWVANARTVTPDAALQRQAVYNVYALLGPNDPGTRRINAFYSRDGESDPFTRAARESVEVQIETALPLTKDSWQVDWVETVRERQSARRTVTTRMRATLQVYQMALNRRTTEEQMRRNPLGIFIRDFTWAKQLDPLPTR